jgi:plastocyanin
LFRKHYLPLFTALALLALAVAPVYATPSLSLGSTASYTLTGRLQASQICNAYPAAYVGPACTGTPVSTSTIFVTITDDGHCGTVINPNDPFSALRCRFTPDNATLPVGGSVVWFNEGNITHAVTANITANNGLPTFNSGPVAPGGQFSLVFNQTGTYQYYDPNYAPLLTHGLMRGTVNVTPPPPPPTVTPTTILVNLAGSTSWNMDGLSSSQANLNVTHQISVSVSPFPGLTVTPVTESGSFQQSINLSTRVESPSTATSIAEAVSTSLLSALAGTTLPTGLNGPVFQSMFSTQPNIPDYTMWWVNGPLSLGSPVQMLQGWSSVTGSESTNVGGNIGTRPAWIVTSQLSQTFNLSVPNPSNPLSSTTSTASASLKLLWSYDKSADLLLRNDNAVNATIHSVTPTTIYTATGPIAVTITRDMTLTLDLALHLSSTNISLPKASSHTSSLMDMLAALPWMPFGIAGLAAGIVAGLTVWIIRRSKRIPLPASVPTTSPASSPVTTS